MISALERRRPLHNSLPWLIVHFDAVLDVFNEWAKDRSSVIEVSFEGMVGLAGVVKVDDAIGVNCVMERTEKGWKGCWRSRRGCETNVGVANVCVFNAESGEIAEDVPEVASAEESVV